MKSWGKNVKKKKKIQRLALELSKVFENNQLLLPFWGHLK